jgi:TetR/AcrR family transcriptional repressor of nem operon
MSKAEHTKAFIIEKVAPVFNKKGYAGTSLSDMTAATGLTKGSIYGNFKNKDEVAVAVYQYNARRLSEAQKNFVAAASSSLEKLNAFAEFYRQSWKKIFERGGCPVMNASVEADDNLPFLKKHVQATIKNWANVITKIIDQGKATGEFKISIVSIDYAYLIITLLEGGIMLSKITNTQNHLFNAVDRIQLIIDQEIKK